MAITDAFNTFGYRFGDTNIDILHMWMVLVSLMEAQESIFGHLLLEWTETLADYLPVPVLYQLDSHLQVLWGMTISVTLVINSDPLLYSMVMILCGMGLVVGLRACAAPLTLLHGSTSSCHSPPLMILR